MNAGEAAGLMLAGFVAFVVGAVCRLMCRRYRLVRR